MGINLKKRMPINLNVSGSGGTFYEYEITDDNGVVLLRKERSGLLNGDIPAALDIIMGAIATEPDTQASDIVFSDVTDTTMTVSWTNGTGANRLVLAHEGAAVDSTPENFSEVYEADAAFGDGSEIGTDNFVVYIGNGDSVAITGLTAETEYHFRAFEFNGTGLSANYNSDTATGNPASQATDAEA